MNTNELEEVLKSSQLLQQKVWVNGTSAQHFSAHLQDSLSFTAVTSDSRQASSSTLFVAVKGVSQDGHRFLPKAADQGTKIFVVESGCEYAFTQSGVVFYVSDTKKALNQIARAFYQDPISKLHIVGVTGTNGKTTVTHMIEHILNRHHILTGIMGTIDHHVGQKVWESNMTTPDTVAFYGRLSDFVNHHARAAALEISSHALKQQRVDDVDFDVAIFTNLTRDHLDYHPTMQDYFESKKLLFDPLLSQSNKKIKVGWVNEEDEWARSIKANWKDQSSSTRIYSFGEEAGDLQFKIHSSNFKGLDVTYTFNSEKVRVQVPLIGAHNASNAAAAIGAALSLGVNFSDAVLSMADFHGVRGRLEKVADTGDVDVFVDYAHTDQALETVLTAMRSIREKAQLKNKIFTVFGCGGDRDKGKRPLMGAVAERLSDVVVATSDNPRSENPLEILNDIKSGLKNKNEVHFEVDRKIAIHWALKQAQAGDVVLVAGKGHEDYQIIGNEKLHFDDVEVVKEYFDVVGTQN